MAEQQIEGLTLLLLYLTSRAEKLGDYTFRRAWKGFRFEALDVLEEAGYITQGRRAKSVRLTEAALERAKVLAAKYLSAGEDER